MTENGGRGTSKMILVNVKGVLHPEPKISMFCALSQNCQHLLKNNVGNL